jgi:peroxiredoxin
VGAVPHLNELSDALVDEPVVFLTVSPESPIDLTSFLANNPMRAWVASDPDKSAAKAMGVAGMPATYLIDPAGEIVWQGKPWDLDEQRIRALLPKE